MLRLSEGYPVGTEVDVRSAAGRIPRTTVVVGSHDLVLDHIADPIQQNTGFRSFHHMWEVWGIDSFVVVRHTWQVSTSWMKRQYNISVNRVLLRKMTVNLSYRIQGCWCHPVIPKVSHLKDLAESGLRFIGGSGSGTRLLFDHLLKEEESPLQL